MRQSVWLSFRCHSPRHVRRSGTWILSAAPSHAIPGPWRARCDTPHGVENIGRPRPSDQQGQRLHRLHEEIRGDRCAPDHLRCRLNAAGLGQIAAITWSVQTWRPRASLDASGSPRRRLISIHTNHNQIKSSRFGFGLKVNPAMPEEVSRLPVLAMPAPSTWPTVRVVLPLAFGPFRGGCTYRCTYFKNVS